MDQLSITVETKDEKKRLDHLVMEHVGDELSRAFVQKLIVGGSVTLNGKKTKPGERVRQGDRIELTVPPPAKVAIMAQDIPLVIVFEDEHLCVIDKPAGMVVHPGAGNFTGTMVNALLAHCKDLSGIGGELRPGIVHRLDKDTSGLIVVAKDDRTHRKLSDQFKKRRIKRKYIAFVKGIVELDNGTVDLPIGRDRKDRQRMAVSFENSKHAITHYKVVKRFEDYTMLELVLETGRTHQIRTHLEYLGHPLLGDEKYGKKSERIARHALHAAVLGFTHPVTKEYLEFESEIPPDMQRLAQ